MEIYLLTRRPQPSPYWQRPGVITISYKKQYYWNYHTSTSKNKTNNSNYFTDKDKDSSYDESKASTGKTVWIFWN